MQFYLESLLEEDASFDVRKIAQYTNNISLNNESMQTVTVLNMKIIKLANQTHDFSVLVQLYVSEFDMMSIITKLVHIFIQGSAEARLWVQNFLAVLKMLFM